MEMFFKHKKIRMPIRALGFFGASVLIGLFKKCTHTNSFSASDIFRFHPHPYGMRLESGGLSHALQNSPQDCFVPALWSGLPFESHLKHKKSATP